VHQHQKHLSNQQRQQKRSSAFLIKLLFDRPHLYTTIRGNMKYVVRIWLNDTMKKEIYFEADNDIIAMQKASAAIPDGCRATYEEINEETYKQETKIKTETINEEDINNF